MCTSQTECKNLHMFILQCGKGLFRVLRFFKVDVQLVPSLKSLHSIGWLASVLEQELSYFDDRQVDLTLEEHLDAPFKVTRLTQQLPMLVQVLVTDTAWLFEVTKICSLQKRMANHDVLRTIHQLHIGSVEGERATLAARKAEVLRTLHRFRLFKCFLFGTFLQYVSHVPLVSIHYLSHLLIAVLHYLINSLVHNLDILSVFAVLHSCVLVILSQRHHSSFSRCRSTWREFTSILNRSRLYYFLPKCFNTFRLKDVHFGHVSLVVDDEAALWNVDAVLSDVRCNKNIDFSLPKTIQNLLHVRLYNI